MANNTISQIKIGNTTYDICDAETRNTLNNLICCQEKLDLFENISSIAANTETTLFSLSSWDPTGVDWADYVYCPTIYHTMVHSRGATRFMRLYVKEEDSNEIHQINSFYINQTYDVVISWSGLLASGLGNYKMTIDSNAAITNVYGNISWIAFKV